MCRKRAYGITLKGGTYISVGTLRTAEAGILTPRTAVVVGTGIKYHWYPLFSALGDAAGVRFGTIGSGDIDLVRGGCFAVGGVRHEQ
eukprot:14815989-Ditylum_brightwellii.AAC.1